MTTTFEVSVSGRPAPQGSKEFGPAGQMREASRYLPGWRAAVKRACYERYRELSIQPGELPLLRGPVAVQMAFYLPRTMAWFSQPDLDKLIRSTWDAMTQARVWVDDSRVVGIDRARRRGGVLIGVDITVTQELKCIECVTLGEDAMRWCLCHAHETCDGPCQQRAHLPENCPNPGKWE